MPATDVRPEERLAEVQHELRGFYAQYDNGGLTKVEAEKFDALREEERQLLAETTPEDLRIKLPGSRSTGNEVKANRSVAAGEPVVENKPDRGFGAVLAARARESLGIAKPEDRDLLAEMAEAERLLNQEERAFGTGTMGGSLGVQIYGAFFDVVRNKSRVFEAGATSVPLTENVAKAPVITGDVSVAWRGEGGAIPTTDAAITTVTFVPKSLGGIQIVSFEAVQDVNTDLEVQLEGLLAGAVALEVDRAALLGSGAGSEPTGLFNTAGVNKTSPGGANGATPTNYDWFVDNDVRLAQKNFEGGAFIVNPRTVGTLAKLKDTTNQPLRAPALLDDAPFLDTNKVPVTQTQGTSTDASTAFQGEWKYLVVGWRLEPQVQVLKERYADTGQVGLLVFARADVQVIRPAAFELITGIRP